MTTKTKIIISIIALATAFASGRFLSPEKTKTVERIVEVEKIVTKVEHSTTVIVEKPDGTKETTIVKDTNTDSRTTKDSTTNSKESTISKDRLNISVLAGMQLPLSNSSSVFGASVTKNLIGPVTVSVWGLSNASGGVGLGLNF